MARCADRLRRLPAECAGSRVRATSLGQDRAVLALGQVIRGAVVLLDLCCVAGSWNMLTAQRARPVCAHFSKQALSDYYAHKHCGCCRRLPDPFILNSRGNAHASLGQWQGAQYAHSLATFLPTTAHIAYDCCVLLCVSWPGRMPFHSRHTHRHQPGTCRGAGGLPRQRGRLPGGQGLPRAPRQHHHASRR